MRFSESADMQLLFWTIYKPKNGDLWCFKAKRPVQLHIYLADLHWFLVEKRVLCIKITEFVMIFMVKNIVTLFLLADNPCGMKPSVTMSSVLLRHPSSALFLGKVPKMPCFCGVWGVGSNEPIDEPSGFKSRGKIKLYQRRSYYAK